ncbi:hypothetical protein CYMTET_29771 [Cymbomonas tetramitiformis]|uniref:RING-CH-type domain-containing protein n=1 Tax=Cymbomonas tetramitiformis TaxID=36881 RepID=A0AAE0KUU1_9CHLO|nr:hypothetical protein CYMTET_29771 [Cymbomonas tetramitiformis]|eukprot:gene27929-34521_t
MLQPVEDLDEERPFCRICLDDDDQFDMIAPCLCAGTSKWVHRACLDEWRAQERNPHSFTHCQTCRFQFVLEPMKEHSLEESRALWRFRAFVARDMTGVFIILQLLITCLAGFIHLCDGSGSIVNLYPKGWAETHAATTSIGPYYISGFILLLAIIGFAGTIWYFCGGGSLQSGRSRNSRHRGCDCVCDCATHCNGPCLCDSCDCASCDCLSGTGGSSDLGGMLFVLVAVVLVFAIIGIFVGIFFGTIVFQRILQRHVHLLWMRAESQKHVVVDLQSQPSKLDRSNVTEGVRTLVMMREV